jgi:hypothetical protein
MDAATNNIRKQLGKKVTLKETESEKQEQVLLLEQVPAALPQFYWNEHSRCIRAVYFYNIKEVQHIPTSIHSYYYEISGVSKILNLAPAERYNLFILGNKRLIIERENVHTVEPIYYALENKIDVEVLLLPRLNIHKYSESALISIKRYKQERDAFLTKNVLAPKAHILTDTTYCPFCCYKRVCDGKG